MGCRWTLCIPHWQKQPALRKCWDFQRTGPASNTSNICETEVSELPGRNSRKPSRILIGEHEHMDVSWACVPCCLRKRLQLSSFSTSSGTSVSSTSCCTEGTHQMVRCQCWSKPGKKSAPKSKVLCDLVNVTVVFHLLAFFCLFVCLF